MKISQFTKEAIEKLTITHKSEIDPTTPIISIDGCLIAIKGGVSMVTGKTGSGKTTVLRVILSLALMESAPPKTYDPLGFEVTPADGKPVIYINTEMPNASLKGRIHDKVLSDIQRKETPSNFMTIQAIGLGIDARRQLIMEVLRLYPDTHLLIIDGGADTVLSVNDEAKSVEAIEELNKLANEYQTTILNVVHENKGNGLTRGHYGQQCERKASGIISVRFDSSKKLFAIHWGKSRSNAPFDPISFRYDDNGDVYRLSPEAINQRQKETQQDELKMLAIECFQEKDRWIRADLVKHIAALEDVDQRNAQIRVRKMIDRAYIAVDGSKHVKCLLPIERVKQGSLV